MAASETTVDKAAGEEHVGNPGGEKGAPEEGASPRARWANKMEFFLCMSTQMVSLNTMWTLPFLFIYNGVFCLIPVCLSLLLCGMPLLFLGLALGQYTSESGVTAWKKICPMFQGIGIATLVILACMNISHALVPVWSLFYLYSSFKSPLPWSTCDNHWNTESCGSGTDPVTSNVIDELDLELNYTLSLRDLSKSPESEFWRSFYPFHYGFPAEEGRGFMMHWNLLPCLLIVWVLCYFCTWKGIKYTGKVMYMVIFPYLLLIVFFIRGVTLPGAAEGLLFLAAPYDYTFRDLTGLLFSLMQAIYIPTCLGVRTSMASYNKYNNNCFRDCIILCALQIGATILLSCIVGSFIGFVSHAEGLSVNEVVEGGLGLVFHLFPMALSRMNVSSFWAVLFFLMIVLLSLSHQFVLVESLVTNISDLLPSYRRKVRRELLVLAICGLCLLLGLMTITNSGVFLFQLVNNFCLSEFTFCFIVCFETVVISWIYGADRFYDNIADMIGYPLFPLLKYCWLFITPLLCGMLGLISQSSYYFSRSGRNVWLKILSVIFSVTPLMCIPVFMVISLCRGVEKTTTPCSDLRQARPHRPELTLCKCVITAGRPQPELSDRDEAIVM